MFLSSIDKSHISSGYYNFWWFMVSLRFKLHFYRHFPWIFFDFFYPVAFSTFSYWLIMFNSALDHVRTISNIWFDQLIIQSQSTGWFNNQVHLENGANWILMSSEGEFSATCLQLVDCRWNHQATDSWQQAGHLAASRDVLLSPPVRQRIHKTVHCSRFCNVLERSHETRYLRFWIVLPKRRRATVSLRPTG